MLSVSEARERILSHFQPVDKDTVALRESAGRVLAENINAGADLPSFDNSSVDGFAVRAADTKTARLGNPVILKVVGDIPAGVTTSIGISEGECARIMTGAPIPAGADTVVMVEDTDHNYRNTGIQAPVRVEIRKSAQRGDNIRHHGADVRTGQIILESPRRLRAQEIGLLAMLGKSNVQVFRRPRLAILSTGDELISISEPEMPGKIRDANSHSLSALSIEKGADLIDLGIAKDNPDSIKKLLDKAIDEKADAIISSAGVSVGAFDYVKRVVESRGSVDFWKVDMRPGKPLAFGEYRGTPFFGLPGNPVSAFIGFIVFIVPALEKLSGLGFVQHPTTRVQLSEQIESDGRESYLRAVVTNDNGHLTARLTGHQVSSNMLSLVQANALLIIPSGVKSVPLGKEVDAWLL